MRGTRQAEFLVRDAEGSGGAVGDEGDGLEELGGGAPEGDQIGVAGIRDERARGVRHGDGDVVARLDDVTAEDVD